MTVAEDIVCTGTLLDTFGTRTIGDSDELTEHYGTGGSSALVVEITFLEKEGDAEDDDQTN